VHRLLETRLHPIKKNKNVAREEKCQGQKKANTKLNSVINLKLYRLKNIFKKYIKNSNTIPNNSNDNRALHRAEFCLVRRPLSIEKKAIFYDEKMYDFDEGDPREEVTSGLTVSLD